MHNGILLTASLVEYTYRRGGISALLQKDLARKVDVLNRAYTKYNTRWISKNLDKILRTTPIENVAFVIVFLGVNDSSAPDETFERYYGSVPVDEYRENIIEITDQLSDVLRIPMDSIVLIGPAPVDEETWNKIRLDKYKRHWCAPELSNVQMKLYGEACEQAAVHQGCRFLSLYENMIGLPHWKSHFIDGVRLNSMGNALLFDMLKEHIKELAEHLASVDASIDVSFEDSQPAFDDSVEFESIDEI